MAKKSKVKPESTRTFNVWVHVEEVTTDSDGNEEFVSLDDEYMPIKICNQLASKEILQQELDFIENHFNV